MSSFMFALMSPFGIQAEHSSDSVTLALSAVAWTPVTSGQNSEWNILNLLRHLGREIQKRRDITASDQLNGKTISSQEAKSLTKKVLPDIVFLFFCACLIHKISLTQNSVFHLQMWIGFSTDKLKCGYLAYMRIFGMCAIYFRKAFNTFLHSQTYDSLSYSICAIFCCTITR